MKLSVWCVVLCAVLYVRGSEVEEKDRGKTSVSCSMGYEVQVLLDQLGMISTKLQDIEGKLQSVEVKIQRVELKQHNMTDNLHSMNDNLQNVKDKLDSAENKIQSMENKAQIMNDICSDYERYLQSVDKILQKSDSKLLHIENYIQEQRVEQLNPTTEIPKTQEPLTTTVKSVSTTTTPKPKQPPYPGCKGVSSKVSGTYMIRAMNDSEPFQVYCEQEKFGGGWIVFQYRYDGSLDFYRGWDEFRDGFGDLNKEFWLGLEKVHQITSGRKHELMVELKDFNGNYKYVRYDAFEIGSQSDQYNLKEFGKNSGNVSDSMSDTKGSKFSTNDRDNDESIYYNCAQSHEGAWWYSGWACTHANLNGRYMKTDYGQSMYWLTFNDDNQGLSYSRMMIRELE